MTSEAVDEAGVDEEPDTGETGVELGVTVDLKVETMVDVVMNVLVEVEPLVVMTSVAGQTVVHVETKSVTVTSGIELLLLPLWAPTGELLGELLGDDETDTPPAGEELLGEETADDGVPVTVEVVNHVLVVVSPLSQVTMELVGQMVVYEVRWLVTVTLDPQESSPRLLGMKRS